MVIPREKRKEKKGKIKITQFSFGFEELAASDLIPKLKKFESS